MRRPEASLSSKTPATSPGARRERFAAAPDSAACVAAAGGAAELAAASEDVDDECVADGAGREAADRLRAVGARACRDFSVDARR